MAVLAAYPAPLFPPFLDPPVELACLGPRGRLHLDRRIDFPAICSGDLLQIIAAGINV